jgi:hypothetical protein
VFHGIWDFVFVLCVLSRYQHAVVSVVVFDHYVYCVFHGSMTLCGVYCVLVC